MTLVQDKITDDGIQFDAKLSDKIDQMISDIPATQLSSVDHHVPILDDKVSIDPYHYFAKLRETHGDVVQYIDGKYGDLEIYNLFGHDLSKPNFAVLGYNNIKNMVTDQENFKNEGSYGQHTKVQLADGVTTVNELDGEEHKTVRKMFDRQVFATHFGRDFMESVTRPTAKYLTGRIRERLVAGHSVDLCRDFALPLLYVTISQVIGVPIGEIVRFVDLGDKAFSGTRDPAAAMEAIGELTEIFRAELGQRRANDDLSRNDLMSAMAKVDIDGKGFSDNEIIIYCRFLLPGGLETTWRQMANICYAMMTHPEQYAEVVSNPKLIGASVEEACRWMASGFIVPRIAAKNTEIAGFAIPAGSSLVGIFGVANHDPEIWEYADKFDIHRKRIPHLTFSRGQHSCMGQGLAKLLFAEALSALSRDLPDIELAVPVSELRTTGIQIRCPDSIPIQLKK